MPYTIVLTPPANQASKYVEVSHTLYRDYQPSYLLAANGSSSPHITVIQFDCSTSELAHDVWAYTCDLVQKESLKPFEPPFSGVSFIEGVGPYEGTTWVELSINRGGENSPIMRVHYAALEALKHFNLEPLNACGNSYRPHLTLARIVMPEHMKTWPKNLISKSGAFHLEFGLSDEKWQYVHKLGSFPE